MFQQPWRKLSFGTLDEIFTQFGVGEEFRERFPTDAEFWNIKKGEYDLFPPSFHSIYMSLRFSNNFY